MSLLPLPAPRPGGPTLAAGLAKVTGPEFAGIVVVRIDPGDPVFGRGYCSVVGL